MSAGIEPVLSLRHRGRQTIVSSLYQEYFFVPKKIYSKVNMVLVQSHTIRLEFWNK